LSLLRYPPSNLAHFFHFLCQHHPSCPASVIVKEYLSTLTLEDMLIVVEESPSTHTLEDTSCYTSSNICVGGCYSSTTVQWSMSHYIRVYLQEWTFSCNVFLATR
jgi:hypothetical protein